jgi:Lyzozyme M1 (1,4-beta-N-acetylmuramidase)
MKMITKLISGMLIAILFSSATVLATNPPTSHAGVLGIDVSKNQGHVDWVKVANAGYKFAFIKSSEGIGYLDKNFAENIKDASVNTLLVAPYHFARPAANKNPEDEAEWFLQVAGDYIKRGYLRPALDVEVPPKNSIYPETEINEMEAMSSSDLQDWVLKWMNYVTDKTGQTPIIYTNKDYYSGKLKKLIDEEKYDVWISDPSTTSCTNPILDEQQPMYSPYPDLTINCIFWQWYIPPDSCPSNKGKVSGINKDVDLDVFSGYERDLLSFTCDSDYGVVPTVKAFKVTPDLHSSNSGKTFKIDFTVLDNGGSGLKQVELWRKDETSDWGEIKPPNIFSGENGPRSGSFTDSPTAPGKYWYGIHVVDNAGNWNDEKNSNTHAKDASRIKVVGEWILHSRRASNFIPSDSTIIFYEDHTLRDSSYGAGRWRQNGDNVHWEYDMCGGEVCTYKTTYDGTIGLDMKGTMQSCDGEEGDWSADRKYTEPGIMV